MEEKDLMEQSFFRTIYAPMSILEEFARPSDTLGRYNAHWEAIFEEWNG